MSCVISTGNAVNIQNADAIAANIKDALSCEDCVTMDVSDLQNADILVLQLIVSSHKFASDSGKIFRITPNDNACLNGLMNRSGLYIET